MHFVFTDIGIEYNSLVLLVEGVLIIKGWRGLKISASS